MVYFKSKAGNICYGSGIGVYKKDLEIMYSNRCFNESIHVEITREEFVEAYEQVIKKINEKVYGSK